MGRQYDRTMGRDGDNWRLESLRGCCRRCRRCRRSSPEQSPRDLDHLPDMLVEVRDSNDLKFCLKFEGNSRELLQFLANFQDFSRKLGRNSRLKLQFWAIFQNHSYQFQKPLFWDETLHFPPVFQIFIAKETKTPILRRKTAIFSCFLCKKHRNSFNYYHYYPERFLVLGSGGVSCPLDLRVEFTSTSLLTARETTENQFFKRILKLFAYR